MAIWHQNDTGTHTIQMASLPAGGSWTDSAQISKSGENSFEPDVSMDWDGNAMVIWYTDAPLIQSAVIPLGQNGSPAVDVSSSEISVASPKVSLDPTGNAVAVWQHLEDSTTRIISAVAQSGGGWMVPTNVSDPGQDASTNAIDHSPTFSTAIWQRSDGPNTII